MIASMQKSGLPTILDFEGTQLTIIDNDGMPWLAAADVALALGYGREDRVSRIYARHRDEFTRDMTALIEAPVLEGSGNLRKSVRIFSPRACHLIAMFSRTDRARAFRRWVLDVLDGVGKPGALAGEGQGLSPLHREQLRKVLWSQVSGLPRHLHATAYSNAWNDLKARFGVTTYHDIPEACFAEAVAFVQGLDLAGKYGWRLLEDTRRPVARIGHVWRQKPLRTASLRVAMLEGVARLLSITPEMIDRERRVRRGS
ncbi:MAG TPA: hypothetical protein DCW68_02720 [Rhodospirillaceae bacterium]|nr:MAG: hypothetical protein A2018_05695 [Alphaproteobacteria bacterium GWF2_58_20]HAU29008.1 hypothetical protein [Rhodospirillaceae bacterium]